MSNIDKAAGVVDASVARAEISAAKDRPSIMAHVRAGLLAIGVVIAPPALADETKTDETIQLALADDLLAGMLDDANTEGKELDARIKELDAEIQATLKKHPERFEDVGSLLDHLRVLKSTNAARDEIIAAQMKIKAALGID